MFSLTGIGVNDIVTRLAQWVDGRTAGTWKVTIMNAAVRSGLISLLIILLGVGGFVLLKATKPPPPEREATAVAPIVRVLEVKKQDITAEVVESGNVQAKTVLDLITEVSGKVIHVAHSLQIGYFVTKGELLVEIDPREYRLSVAQFKAQAAQLRAEMARLAQERQNILRNLEVEKAKVDLVRSELARKKKLYESGSLSQSDYDRQNIEFKQTEVSFLNQQNALALLESAEELTTAKMEATDAQLESAKLKLEKTKIFAPFNGRVQDEDVDEGEYIATGKRLATIYDISTMEIVINLAPEKAMQLIDPLKDVHDFSSFPDLKEINALFKTYGPKGIVRLRIQDHEVTWPCQVSRLKGALDQTTRTIPVVVEVKDPFKEAQPGVRPSLVPGMFVDVLLQGKLFKDVVKIPRNAIHEGKAYLLVHGKLQIKPVEVAMVTKKDAVVSKGLNNGDKVILSPLAVPIPDSPLREAEKASAEQAEDSSLSGRPAHGE